MGGGLTFAYNITGSCNCGRKCGGRRPMVEWSSIKSDVTKHTFSGNGGRQPSWVFFFFFFILLTNARFRVFPIYLLFLSALLIYTPSTDVVYSHRTCLMHRSGLGGGGCCSWKQVTSGSFSPFPAIKSRYFTGSSLQTEKKKWGRRFLDWVFIHFPLSIRRAPWCKHA